MRVRKILIGIPPKAHVSLAMDEIDGLKNIGFDCYTITYGRNNQTVSIFNKFVSTIIKGLKLTVSLYKTQPEFLYLNSRFEPAGSTRDFISLLIVKIFYFRPLKIMIKSHGSDSDILHKKSFWYKKLVIPFLRKTVTGWFFLSQEEKKIITAIDPKLGGKIFITPNIIDPSRCQFSAEFQQKYNLSNEKFNLLFVGRMVRVKGVFDIIEAIPQLKEIPNLHFIFVGDGTDLNALKYRAEELGIKSMIDFPGYLPDAECDHFYANSNALIFPTYDTEGFPMALFKSVSVGLPVITTQIRAAKDYLTEPENVLWVLEKSPESIKKVIKTLYNNKELQNTIRENNLILGKRFSKEVVSKQMKEVLFSLA